MNIKILEEKKASADKNWDAIVALLNSGEKIEKSSIVNAMQRCNDADQAILDYNKSFSRFMKEREV